MKKSSESPNLARSALSLISGILLVALFFLSVKSLTTFPDPFDDEGIYAAYAEGWASTGKFNSPSVSLSGKAPFTNGNGMYSRVNTGIYGSLGKIFGYSLGTARSIPFTLIWLSTIFWFFISRRLGMNGLLGSLLFASTERVFYASHVFRPESTLLFCNTVFIGIIVFSEGAALKATSAFSRGLFNGAAVISHGNGLVTAVLNSIDLALRRFSSRRNFFSILLLYGVGSILAIGAFYFIQIYDIGGLEVLRKQMRSLSAYEPRSLLESIKADFSHRWGRELIIVGGSQFAKVLRIYFYAVVLSASLYSSILSKGLTKRLGLLSLGCFWGYVFLVQDKIDIHVAEMIPFFLAAFTSWSNDALSSVKLPASVTKFLSFSLVAVGVFLSFHHAIKYRGPSETDRTIVAIETFLNTETIRPKSEYRTIVADTNFWFHFYKDYKFVSSKSSRYSEPFIPVHGGVIVIKYRLDQIDDALKRCQVDYGNPSLGFTALYCP